MYSWILPKGVTEDDLSSDDDVVDGGSGAENVTFDAENSVSQAEKQSAVTVGDADTESPTCSLPGVPQESWQRFQDLRKKNEQMKVMKIPKRRKRRRKKGTESEAPTETKERQEARQKHWDELSQYFGVNDRFYPPACSKPPPKSGLEKSIERAIAEGDIAKAEEMSDSLATREMAVKIGRAADCRDFVQHKQEEEALRAAQKRKKQIAWGFEAKKRWETKSNMGFM
ncbi:protein FAM204A isoform X2 [Gouania willdenowi]|uniref:Family with sequence similarity 204 member A n=1 Tax=Gouania willdenowi TaxID=441366 RepID=A0A8C5I402_GOUWI|nr:protein FAM204A isoform X2 [Gouania willdenowi]